MLGSFSDIENVALFVRLYRCLLVSVYLLQEAHVIVIDVAGFEGVPNCFVRDGVERPSEVYRRCPHFDSPLMAFLFNQSVCCKVVCCLVGFCEASLIFCLFFWSSTGFYLPYRIVEDSLYNAGNEQVGR